MGSRNPITSRESGSRRLHISWTHGEARDTYPCPPWWWTARDGRRYVPTAPRNCSHAVQATTSSRISEQASEHIPISTAQLPPARSPLKGGAGGSRAGVEATGQRTGESTRDENSRANDGNRYQDVKLKTEQASDYHAMVPKSHGEIPKSCTKSLPATPIVTAPTIRA